MIKQEEGGLQVELKISFIKGIFYELCEVSITSFL